MLKGRLTEVILVASAIILSACLVFFSVSESTKVTQADVVYKTKAADSTDSAANTDKQSGADDVFSEETGNSISASEISSLSPQSAAAETQPSRTAAVARTAATKARTTAANKTSRTATTKFSGVMNINTATAQELTQLDGIGEVIAQRIVEYRSENGAFAAVEDIMNVKGIGEKKFAAIKPHISVR